MTSFEGHVTKIPGGILLICHEAICDQIIQEVGSDKAVVEIKKLRRARSLDQNAIFHALCGLLAKENQTDKEVVKAGLVLQYGSKRKDHHGRLVSCPTHLMDVVEFGEIINGAFLECWEQGLDTTYWKDRLKEWTEEKTKVDKTEKKKHNINGGQN